MLLRPWIWFERAAHLLLLALLPALACAQPSGSDPLAEAPVIQERIRVAIARGDADSAWDLEQSLLRLVAGHPNDLRSARILRDVADRRIAILARFNAGEYVPEIELGCYYNNQMQADEAMRRGSQPVYASAVGYSGNNTCASGSHTRAARALAGEALYLYVDSARILARTPEAGDDELQALVMTLLPVSYQILNHITGRSSLEMLLSHQESNSASSLTRARTLAYMGDWDLLFVPYLGSKYSESAAAAYRDALSLLAENEVSEEAIDSIFSPQTPILLPAFGGNRLDRERRSAASGHVDVSFEIKADGRSARVKVLNSSVDAPRSVERELAATIRNGRFRPIAANGEILESAPVTLRYYLSD